MAGASHIIRKQVIDIRRQGGAGLAAQSDAEQLWHQHLRYDLEALLDRYSIPGQAISLGRIEIDITDMTAGELKSGNTDKIIRRIEEQLQRLTSGSADSEYSVQETSFFRKWIFCLEHGHLPWWSHTADSGNWQEQLSDFFKQPLNTVQLKTLKALLPQENVCLRLAAALSNMHFQALLVQLYGSDHILQLLRDTERLATVFPGNQQDMVYAAKTLLLDLTGKETPATTLPVLFTRRFKKYLNSITLTAKKVTQQTSFENPDFKDLAYAIMNQENSPETTREIKQAPLDTKSEKLHTPLQEEEIFLSHAGLVLTAVYLPAFFERLGLRDGNQLKDINKCIALVQYLATGNHASEEFDCVMAKILCGLLPQDFADPHVHISEEDRAMADSLLHAIISNWSKIGNSSPDGLRGNFLNREGKLTLKDNTWSLQVEHKTFDILLQFLPWSISIIKLPWMSHMLTVKWE